MSEDDDKKIEPNSTEQYSQAVDASDQQQPAVPQGQAQQKADEGKEANSPTPEAAPAPEAASVIGTPPDAETSAPVGDKDTSHKEDTPQASLSEQEDKRDIPEHDIPQHTVPPTAAEGNVPPHEVPQHTVPPVNRPQTGQPPTNADPDQMVEPNLVNRAVDVIASSSNQRDAVQRSFELQRATIAHGIKTRRDAAMEQAAAAKANIGPQHSPMPQQGATSMNQQYAAPPQPQAAPAQQYQAAPQPGSATHPGMAGYAGAAPLSNNEIIAQEFATTLRQIIAEEVDKQLKALLAAYTSGEAGTAESPVE